MKQACGAYRDAMKVPQLSGARIESISAMKDGAELLNVSSEWSQVNLSSYTRMLFSKNYIIDTASLSSNAGGGGAAVLTGNPQHLDSHQLAKHKNGKSVYVRGGKEKDEQFVDIWEEGSLSVSYSVKDVDKHGLIYSDAEFGSLDISQDGSTIVVVAEKKVPKSLPFLHQGDGKEDTIYGKEYTYRQDWGEQLVGKIDPILVVLTIGSSGKLEPKVIDTVPGIEGWSLGQAQFLGSSIVGLAYSTIPRKLGKKFCSNREACLFSINLDGTGPQILRRITNDGCKLGMQNLLVNNVQGRLVWLERTIPKLGTKTSLSPGPHQTAWRMMGLDSLDGEPYEIVSESCPAYSSTGEEGDAAIPCGIFAYADSIIAQNNFWVGDDHLLISLPRGQTTEPMLINCKERKMECLRLSNSRSKVNAGVTVLNVCGDYVLGAKSDPATPPYLVIARIDKNCLLDMEFLPVTTPLPLEQLKWGELELPNQGGAFYAGPKDVTDGPLIVLPHGGPHGVTTTRFYNSVLFYAKLGYTILFVNYRGSLGYGKEVVDALPGNVGDMDVQDCIAATDACLDKIPGLSKQKVFLCGGSHGGFLVLHLAGQSPDKYKGVVAINPVANIASMCDVTDIPDWCFNESGLDYPCDPSQASHYASMFAKSPIAHINKIEAPILFQLGKLDLRVPPSQSIHFYHTLKSLGCDVRMEEYEDNHAIAKPQHDANLSIGSAIFFNEIVEKMADGKK